MKEIGTQLKLAREKRGLTLHEVGMSLKINPKILQAIEDGDTQKLPAKTFLRGFVKSYATFVKLDVNKIMGEYNVIFGDGRPTFAKVDITQSNPAAENAAATEKIKSPISPIQNTVAEALKAGDRLTKNTNPEIAHLSQETKVRPVTLIISAALIIAIVALYKTVDRYSKERPTKDQKIALSTEPAADKAVPAEEKPNGDTEVAATEANTAKEKTTTAPEAKPTPETKPAETVVAAATTPPASATLPATTTAEEKATTSEKELAVNSAPENHGPTYNVLIDLFEKTSGAHFLPPSYLCTPPTLMPNSVSFATLITPVAPPVATTPEPVSTPTPSVAHQAEKPNAENHSATEHAATTAHTPATTPTPPPPAAPPAPEKAKPVVAAPATPTPAPTTAATTTPEKPVSTESKTRSDKLNEVILEAKKSVQIKYQFGEEPLQNVSLNEGQVHTFKSKKIILLDISDGGAVSVIVNGVDRGIPGSAGQPTKMSYPR